MNENLRETGEEVGEKNTHTVIYNEVVSRRNFWYHKRDHIRTGNINSDYSWCDTAVGMDLQS